MSGGRAEGWARTQRVRAPAAFVALFTFAVAGSAAAQGVEPLHKSDLVRLLASPLIHRGEVADLIRRNCLAFRPTERDWSDLRTLGADVDVLSSIGACTTRAAPPAARAALALEPLSVVPSAAPVVAAAGTDAVVEVRVSRGRSRQAGLALVLRGSSRIPGGSPRDAEASTDDSGLAVFRVPAGRTVAAYRLDVMTSSGVELPGRPAVELRVGPAQPTVADLRPDRATVTPGETGPLALVVALKDSFSNPIAGETLELRPGSAELGIPGQQRATDSLGGASFLIDRAAVRHSGTLDVWARGRRIAALDVALADLPERAASAGTGFVPKDSLRGVVRHHLPQPLAFQVRGPSGRALAGRVVSLRARNATLASDSAVTDSAGRVQVDVTLGTQAGVADITASVDSVEQKTTILVDPGPAVEFILERDGLRAESGHILVALDTSFELTVKARDGYGNVVPVRSLAQMLERTRGRFNAQRGPLRLSRIRPGGPGAIMTFQSVALGSTSLKITAAGSSASVEVDVVPSR